MGRLIGRDVLHAPASGRETHEKVDFGLNWMLVDYEKGVDADLLESDVCVVGAGAAGITLTRDLLRLGHRVCLLEAGGRDFDASTQALYAGDNTGMTYYELADARLRFFGGTTNIWGGRCALLDEIDFVERPWIPLSGWPLTFEDLLPWYRRAHDSLELGDFDYDGIPWLRRVAAFDLDCVEARLWRFDQTRERFGWRNHADLAGSPRCQVVLHANVTDILVNEAADRVSAVRVKSLGGRSGLVRARMFVLAAGAVENARLLLMSRESENTGVGNRHDQVGRYFMEHPHGRIGRVHTHDGFRFWEALRKVFPGQGPPLAPVLVLSAAAQRHHRVLNSAVTFKLQRDPALGLELGKQAYRALKHQLNPTRSGRMAHHAYRCLRDWTARYLARQIKRWQVWQGSQQLHIMIRAEQAPNAASRVLLADERDVLGCPKTRLHWQLGEQDKRTASVAADILDGEFRRLGFGRVEKAGWLQEPGHEWPVDPTVSNHPIGGYHHMGTTRMSRDPRQGVVDADCRVHGYDNLFVAGSSVFATGGWANPTLTILALALRLGSHMHDHLSRIRLSQGI